MDKKTIEKAMSDSHDQLWSLLVRFVGQEIDSGQLHAALEIYERIGHACRQHGSNGAEIVRHLERLAEVEAAN